MRASRASCPRLTCDGENIGRWTALQRRDFGRLSEEQQCLLAELGLKPARAVRARSAAATTGTASTFRARRGGVPERRPGSRAVPRVAYPGGPHAEQLADGAEHRTGGVDRQLEAAPRPARGRPDQLAAFAHLGIDWAGQGLSRRDNPSRSRARDDPSRRGSEGSRRRAREHSRASPPYGSA